MGIDGLLTPANLAEALPIAVMAVRSGGRYIAPSFVEDVLAAGPQSRSGSAPTEALTDAELKVLRMMAVGMRNVEIAREIYVSLPTVKRCTQRIYLKLGARDRAQSIDIAHRWRLI
jgi:DNA-binding NarL/FixJ family response regulator